RAGDHVPPEAVEVPDEDPAGHAALDARDHRPEPALLRCGGARDVLVDDDLVDLDLVALGPRAAGRLLHVRRDVGVAVAAVDLADPDVDIEGEAHLCTPSSARCALDFIIVVTSSVRS